MPLFIGFHRSKDPVPENRIPRGWATYKKIAQEMGLKPIKLYVNAKEGIGYCFTEAPTKEAVIKAHKKQGLSLEEIFEVKSLD